MENLNYRICSIDGDEYIQTLPSPEIWKSMLEHAGEFDEIGDIMDGIKCPLLGCDPEGSYFLWSNTVINPGERLSDYLAYQEDSHDWQFTGRQPDMIFVRLMLIPLNKRHEQLSRIFWKDNPNGTLVSGGSFYGGAPMERCDLPLVVPNDQSRIGDTRADSAISWIVWNGCLISRQPCYVITKPQHLIDLFLDCN